MHILVSPVASVITKNMAFICGSVFNVLLFMNVCDKDVLNVERAHGGAVADAIDH